MLSFDPIFFILHLYLIFHFCNLNKINAERLIFHNFKRIFCVLKILLNLTIFSCLFKRKEKILSTFAGFYYTSILRKTKTVTFGSKLRKTLGHHLAISFQNINKSNMGFRKRKVRLNYASEAHYPFIRVENENNGHQKTLPQTFTVFLQTTGSKNSK